MSRMHSLIISNAQGMVRRFFAFLLLFTLSSYAAAGIIAEVVDEISLTPDPRGDVDAVIRFSVPVQYLRHFPQKKTPYFVIYFNVPGSVPRDQWQDYETHRSPPSDVVAGFTVSTRDVTTGPKVEVQFVRPAEFTVSEGRDGRSILIHIRPDRPQDKKDGKPAGPGAALPVPLAAPALPLAGAATAVAAAATATGAKAAGAATGAAAGAATGAATGAAPPSAAPAPAASSAPVTPSQPLTSPGAQLAAAATQPTAGGKAVRLPIGGADGLPPFPVVEIAAPPKSPAANLTLAEQIQIANGQAAQSMLKGGNAMLSGQMFAAVDAFNAVLALPVNRYSADAQLWIAIAREKSGQLVKARFEYDTYLKLYPDGAAAPWVKARMVKLGAALPAAQPAPPPAQNTPFQTSVYGSYSMYYYRGASRTDTVTTVGNVQTPTSLSLTDQSSLISNISFTARSYNSEYDNRLVFQDFYAANYLKNQQNRNRLNSFFFETRNRIDDYSARIGRQSALGGGVLGRFDGISAGQGFLGDYRANVVAGQLADYTLGPKPVFYGASLDFGTKEQVGGSVYGINQTVGGVLDRRAVGGNLRYFQQGATVIGMWDYDTQFRSTNMATLQGTLNTDAGVDYNFLLDRRRSPSLSIRNAVNGTTTPLPVLLANGFTQADLIDLAKMRTTVSHLAQVGMNIHLADKWQLGTDLMGTHTYGLVQSGTLNPDGTVGLEGFVPAQPSTGKSYTITERLVGNDVFSARDVSMASISYTTSPMIKSRMLLLNNHSMLQELWTLDTTLRLYWQNDNLGGRQNVIAPVLKVGYRMKQSLTVETEGGMEWTRANPSALMSSRTRRNYIAMGFRWDF
jgi:hypothetical protein